MKKLLFILTLALIIGIFYFSWLPDSTLTSERYLPIWLLNWSNEYVNLRTAVPFVVIGVVLEARSGLQKPVKKNSLIKVSFKNNFKKIKKKLSWKNWRKIK